MEIIQYEIRDDLGMLADTPDEEEAKQIFEDIRDKKGDWADQNPAEGTLKLVAISEEVIDEAFVGGENIGGGDKI